MDFDRYEYVHNSPINANDPSGHMPSDGCRTEECSIKHPEIAPSSASQQDPLINYSDEYGLCLANLCSGGEQYKNWWINDYQPILDQNIDSFLNTTSDDLLPFVDGVQGYTGREFVTEKIGFGLDFVIQIAKDRNKNLAPRQRLIRGIVVGLEGVAISGQSVNLANVASVAMTGPATTLAVRTGNLNIATFTIGGTWVGTYLITNNLFSATPILGFKQWFLSCFLCFTQEFRSFLSAPGSVCRKPDGNRGNFGRNRR